MKNFFLYFHYRVYQLYDGTSRSDGPVGLFIALNLSLLLNIALRLSESGLKSIGTALILLDCILLFLISVIIAPLLIYKNKKYIFKKMDEFKKESALERRKNGRKIVLYIILSVLLLGLSFVKA